MKMVVAMMTWIVPVSAFAQANNFQDALQSGIAGVITYLTAGLSLLTWVFFILLSVLLDPNFMFGNIGNSSLEELLNSIWILSRDVMNIVFAFLLIAAAIYTIVTAKKDIIAKHLKDFVLCVILVNFSWFIPRIILDVANVTAAIVYSIPNLMASNNTANACKVTYKEDMSDDGLNCQNMQQVNGEDVFECSCAVIVDAEFFLTAQRAKDQDANGWYCPLGSAFCVLMEPLDLQAVSGHSAILNGLIVNHARLQYLNQVTPVDPNASIVQAFLEFSMKQLFVLIIYIALLFPLAAMTLAFAIRIPVLWLTMAFMPFALIKYAVPSLSGYVGDYPQKILDNFIAAAFLPAIVGVPLSVGFIMVNAGANMTTAVPQLQNLNFSVAGIDKFQSLFWLAMTLGVLYTGVFTVLGSSKLGLFSKGSQVIKSIGDSLGSLAIKAPLNIPILPSGGTLMSAVKPFDPRILNRLVDNNPEGFGGVFKDMAGGKVPGNGEIVNAAKNLEEVNLFRDIDKSLKDISTNLQNGNNAEVDRLVGEIGKKLSVTGIDSKNVEQRLTMVVDEMRKQKPGSTNADELAKRIKEITDARPKPANP